MARFEPEANVTLSFIDRLIDLDPANPASEAPLTHAQSVRQLKASLRRDLEWLLNTRRHPDPAGEDSPELENSLYNYGLADIAALAVHSAEDQNRLLWMIESAVATFEPRIQAARVSLEPVAPNSRVLRFQIEGLLMLDPAPERVSFDTVLELTSGEYAVKGA